MQRCSGTYRMIGSASAFCFGLFLTGSAGQLAERAACADPAWNGHYILETEAKLSAKKVYERTYRPTVDVVVESANAPGQHKFRIGTEGRSCVITGSVSESDPSTVVLTPGQSCDQQNVSAPDFTASLQTTLDQGNAQFQDGQLTLFTRWIVKGEVTLRANPETPTKVNKAILTSRGTGKRQP